MTWRAFYLLPDFAANLLIIRKSKEGSIKRKRDNPQRTNKEKEKKKKEGKSSILTCENVAANNHLINLPNSISEWRSISNWSSFSNSSDKYQADLWSS